MNILYIAACFFVKMSRHCECLTGVAIQGGKPTVRYRSEYVESERKIKSLLFRQFIYVKLRIAVGRCKNLPFTCKNA